MVGQLPIIRYQGKYYFYDSRLREIRNVYDFMDSVQFDNLDPEKIEETNVSWERAIDEEKWQKMFQ